MSSHHEQIQKLNDLLENWDYQLDRLEHRIKGLPNEISDKVQSKYQQLKAYQSQLLDKEKSLEEGAQEAIDVLETNIQETLSAMNLLFDEIELDVQVDVS